MKNCINCKKELDIIDIFPDGSCVDCYEAKMAKIPTYKLDKPNFIKALKI